jgi:hypothetical protein
MSRFRPAGPNGRVPLAGVIEASWWGGFEQTVFEEPAPPPIPEPVYSSTITRPACACKILGQGGCAVPQEGAPTGGTIAKPSEGPSTAVVAGGIGVVALLGLLATGVI